ncbi:calcium-activated chloride channel regulator 1-like isoform X1 [Lytechinus variegatus]|uniref:calcium-activated chloride channel regulator 1-like isoform X1 n=1 Tax=Lytechinus variegatus TaxID=7654 RepID=UPI001BB1703A|nr:calcium-activated chloride channel regulator 1-like isoform X1 [Lytechinus variegatus]
MHITPEYILQEMYRENKYGPTDSVLVRNWGYLRWGLFKEHYDPDDVREVGAPAYDIPGGGTEGTRCSLKIKGEVLHADGRPCQKTPNSDYDPSCRFVPNTAGQTATASLLFGTRNAPVHSIEEFCSDDISDPHSLHNPLAPNLMNNRCNGESAWKVMERTGDFKAGIHPVLNTTPSFELLQLSTVRSVVLVLDISGSMGGNRFDRMIQSSTDYIMNVIPEGSKLGIVVFESTSQIRASLTDVTDTTSRQYLASALPPSAGGSTCIGCGILSGIQVLGSYAQGGYILLLSDGGENISPYIRDTYDEIENSGVIMDTITISNSADQQLEDLSNMTSGISTFCSDSGTGTCLIQAFQSTITERPDVGMETVPIQIYSSEIVIDSSPGFEIVPIIIDAALGNNTVITVIWTTSSSISVEVTGPSGTLIDENDPRYHIDLSTKIVTVNLPFALPGRWNVTIYSTQGITEHASVAVTSKPSQEEYQPVTVTVLLGSREVDLSQTPALAIYARVQQDHHPVLNADVTAIISDANAATTTMSLLDGGSGSDLFKDDGTYSGFFLGFASNGRYNVKVNVIGYEDVIKVSKNRRRRRSTTVEVGTIEEPSFMRTASGGVFKVQSYTANLLDTIAPSRIQDLIYESFSYDNSTVTLDWTAVGDDMDHGTAYSYELRYSTNFSEVRDDFNKSHLVSQEQVLYGNLSHVNASGTTESVTITLPQKGEDIVYYFGIRAWDEAGNGGDLSNIASLSIRFIPMALPTAVMTTDMTEIITSVDQTESIAPGTSETSSENILTSSDTLITTSDNETPTSGLTTEFIHTFPGSQSTPRAETTDVMTEIITTLDKTESIAPGTIETSSEDIPTSSETLTIENTTPAIETPTSGLTTEFIHTFPGSPSTPRAETTDVMTEIITTLDKTESIAPGTIETSSEDIPTSSDTLNTTSDIETTTSGLTTELIHTIPGSQSTPGKETTFDITTGTSTTTTNELFSQTSSIPGFSMSSTTDQSTQFTTKSLEKTIYPRVSTSSNQSIEPKTSSTTDTTDLFSTHKPYTSTPFTTESRPPKLTTSTSPSEIYVTTHQENPETTVSKQPEPLERTTHQEIPETTVSKQPEPLERTTHQEIPETTVSKQPEPWERTTHQEIPETTVSKQPEPWERTTHQEIPETTVSKQPEPWERTTHQEAPESTKATEPTGPEAQAVIIGLSCALSAVTIIAAVSLVYIYNVKQSLNQVKPITPPQSAWAHQGIADVEMAQKEPSYNHPTFKTA